LGSLIFAHARDAVRLLARELQDFAHVVGGELAVRKFMTCS